MLALILSAVATCVGSLAVGQAILAVCGARSWSWFAPPVGLAALILVCVPAIHVPGRSTTTAACLAILIGASLILWARRPHQRPPLSGVLAALPVALLVLVPFAASGRAGTLGMSFDNDMAEHLLLAEAYRSHSVASVSPLLAGYPLGPHAFAATLAEGMGVRVDLAFAGLSAAVPVLLAWTAQACVGRVRWPGRVLVGTVVGIPYLVAAYYGEGAFKEVMEALFALATALILAIPQPDELRWRRWVPLALVLAGAVSVYSLQGLVWPAAFIAIWVAGRAIGAAWMAGSRAAWRELLAELAPAAAGLAVLIVVLVPQIPRVARFVSQGATGSIAKSSLGNLVGPLPVWEAFGAWNNPDLRFPASPAFTAGMWTAFVLALVIVGAVATLRDGRWMLAAAAAASILIWVYADNAQSPYVAAKALVIAAPLLLLLASMAVIERPFPHGSGWGVIAPVLAVALAARVVDSSWEALRFSKVAPSTHLLELRSMRPLLGDQPTLFLADDDFYAWELAGAHVTAAFYAGVPEVQLRPEKAFTYPQPLDFDTLTASTMNAFDWFITTRDAAASEPPPQMRLVRITRDYELWRRVGEVAPRRILAEGPRASAKLDCSTSVGRAILRAGGVAAVREMPAEVAVPPVGPGGTVTVTLQLAARTWGLETPYFSPLPIEVTGAGLATTLPANLERPGPRWPIGRIVVRRPGPVKLRLHVVKYWLTPDSDAAELGAVIATPVGGERIVPVHAACGRLVDWYRSG